MTGAGDVPRLHVLTDERDDVLHLVDVALAAGAPAIQLRRKRDPDADLLALASEVVVRCHRAGAVCIVNDRADIAVAAGADGVHVGATDLPVAAVRRVVGQRLLVGATVRDADAARRAVTDGADYLGVGPVFSTATKQGLPAPIGTTGLAAVVDAVDVPVLGIAGVTTERVPAVRATGAHGVAVTSAVTGAVDAGVAVRQLLDAVAGDR